jgi:YidC/Oxa1 family membrane protein insertase
MKLSTFFKLTLTALVVACVFLITVEQAWAADAEQPQMTAAPRSLTFSSINTGKDTAVLGQVYEKIEKHADLEKYKFQIEFTNQGAAVKQVSLSEFSERDSDGKKPYLLCGPIQFEKTAAVQPSKYNLDFLPLYTLTNKKLYLATASQAGLSRENLPFIELDRLNWKILPSSNRDEVVFEAILGDVTQENGKNIIANPILRIQKKYTVSPGSYTMGCELILENLTNEPLYAEFEMQGTGAIRSEEISAEDRNIKKGFWVDNKTVDTRAMPFAAIRETEKQRVVPSEGFFASLKSLFGSKPKNSDQTLAIPYSDSAPPFLWAAATNKYFAAIVCPVSDMNPVQDIISFRIAQYFDLDITTRKEAPGASASFVLETAKKIELLPKTSENNTCHLKMDVYWGPKDHKVFSENKDYTRLGYFQTMDFNSCCCPKGLISPLAFGIVWLMNVMYHTMGPLGNYGIVIMVFVCLIRLLMHPVTKRSQVQMMKMQKLMPKFQELQKKMGKDRTKMDPEMMAINKEIMQGQMLGMLPMFIQMPVWIALWTAVSINVDLRGQGFLPFWITDLSRPDALFHFTSFTIPLIGMEIGSFNPLPLLMGFVMYLQMKLTPTSQAAPASPEMAQQQKMMSILMVGMFPFMLYNGPSGVNLYIMASMAAGVVEQYIIRKHLQEKQELEEDNLVPTTAKLGKVKKKKPKPMFKFDR